MIEQQKLERFSGAAGSGGIGGCPQVLPKTLYWKAGKQTGSQADTRHKIILER